MTRSVTIAGTKREHHVLAHADSRNCEYRRRFDLVLTSPPFYHPTRAKSPHGIGFAGDLDQYANFVADVLARCSDVATRKRICVIKTDTWHKSNLLPIGFKIVDACVKKGLRLRAHWVWERMAWFSPYGPSFTNVFVLGDDFRRPHISGLFSQTPLKPRSGLPNSFCPEIFARLIELLSESGDIVLDPFAGLGGVIEAAASCGRCSLGVELSAIQIRKAVRRLRSIPGFVVKYRSNLETT
jgi:DNA modification methylase